MPDSILNEVHYLEDSNDEVFLSRLLLENENVDIEIVHHVNLDQLEKRLKRRPQNDPMLVMIDLNMPGMKGTSAIEKIRSKFPLNNLFVGICTGSEDPADRQISEQVGAQFFLHKPLDLVSLQATCDQCERLKMQERESGELVVVASIDEAA